MRKNNLIIMAGILTMACALLCPMKVRADEYGYSYLYDYWGDVKACPDTYTVQNVFTSAEMGLEIPLKNPQGLFNYQDNLYLCDSGNNRIIELNMQGERPEVLRIITSFKGESGEEQLLNPTDIAISNEGNIFIADQGNSRVLKLNSELEYIMEFTKPADNTLDPSLVFQPTKLVIDSAERVYCIAVGINKGLIKYENDGTFSGFIGATPASYDFADYVWKKLATQEQRAKMVSFVPTEYDNIYIDYEGFIYACTGAVKADDLRKNEGEAVRKLNLMGSNILVQNGEYRAAGDLYFGKGGGYEGPSYFTDITVFDNDIYVCLDRNRGRIFAYDDQGRMVFAFGGNGNMDGYFRRPAAIEHIGRKLYVVDSLDCSITAFAPTEFGSLIYEATEEFTKGNYDKSLAAWEQVMALNGNYDLAYLGIGRALLRQENYKEAMEYFELIYDDDNYSKAYKQYRKQWVEENIVAVVIVILAIFLLPLGIGRFRSIKQEIDRAEVFELNGKE